MMQEVIADIFDKGSVVRKKDVPSSGHKQADRQRDSDFITSCRCAVSPHNQSTAASSGTTVIKSLAIKIANEIIHGAESGVALIRENRERFKFSSITSRRKVIKGSQYRQVVENKVQVKLGKAASSYFPQAACLRWVIVTGIG